MFRKNGKIKRVKKVISVIGARPQFIKASALSRVLGSCVDLQESIVHTGQHYDTTMSSVFFRDLNIPEPRYNLGVGSSSHAKQTGEIMKLFEQICLRDKPNLVLIYGDTNSTIAAALVAAKLNIPIAHVEAGLRSFNRRMPEEINRIVADSISTLHFAPTSAAVKNLAHEGISRQVYLCGDVMYDVALWAAKLSSDKSIILSKLGLAFKSYILATIHRAENTDNRHRLTNAFLALGAISKEVPVVLPIHPRTKKMVDKFAINTQYQGLIIIDPVGFFDMVALENGSRLIVTDSGGVQKEAYFHRTPCVTLRSETEWVETIDAGWNRLADASDEKTITNQITIALNSPLPSTTIEEYGEGDAAMKISKIIQTFLT